jgi:hypothetical protein
VISHEEETTTEKQDVSEQKGREDERCKQLGKNEDNKRLEKSAKEQ